MVTLTINNQAHLYPFNQLLGSVLAQIKERLTFPLPAFLKAEKRNFYTGNLEQEIVGYQVAADVLTIPRGFTRQLMVILRGAAVQYSIEASDHGG